MKVIIKDEIKEVKNGYGRNFLLPKGMAVLATSEEIKKLEEKRKKIVAKNARLTRKLEKLKINIKVKAGDSGKLFGAVTKKEIQEELKKNHIKITGKNILLDQPIKEVGEYQIQVNLGFGQKQPFGLVVESRN